LDYRFEGLSKMVTAVRRFWRECDRPICRFINDERDLQRLDDLDAD